MQFLFPFVYSLLFALLYICDTRGSLSDIVSILSWYYCLYFMLFINYSYRGGVDSEGRPVMVVVGAHFLLRCLDLERFVLYVVKVIES